MSNRSSKAMKIPGGRKPGLDSGGEASTSGDVAPACAREELTQLGPQSGVPSGGAITGAKGVASTASCQQKSCFPPIRPPRTMRRSRGFALAWDHIDLAPRSTVLCHTGSIYPNVCRGLLVPGTTGNLGVSKTVFSQSSAKGARGTHAARTTEVSVRLSL